MIARLALLESGAPINIRRMDIHLAKEQLSPWYLAINPAMTVPSLTDEKHIWTDIRAIIDKSASIAGSLWHDVEPDLSSCIREVVDAHYAISIERLAFSKAMTRFKPLQIFFPRLLKRIIHQLETSLPSSINPQATQDKIALNQERLAYFTQGSLSQKLIDEREQVNQYLSQLPALSGTCLFGEKLSSVDIVTSILFARLEMSGELSKINVFPALAEWYKRMQARSTFKSADVWTYFQPWRILLKY